MSVPDKFFIDVGIDTIKIYHKGFLGKKATTQSFYFFSADRFEVKIAAAKMFCKRLNEEHKRHYVPKASFWSRLFDNGEEN